MRPAGSQTLTAPEPEVARPLVSVIVPTYNASAYIADTIASVLAQTYPTKELIIVDDGSTDDTDAVIHRLYGADPRVRFTRLERNRGGPAWARNVGVTLARGDYLAFLDADDLWHPQKLDLQMAALERYKVPFVSTDVVHFGHGEESTLSPLRREAYDLSLASASQITHGRLLRKNIIPNSSVLIDRRAFDRIEFLEDRSMVAIEDYECWLRLHQRIGYSIQLKLPLMYYRLSPGGISRSKLFMLRRVNHLLKRYNVDGSPLGWRRYYYLGTYAALSLWGRVARRLAPSGARGRVEP